MAEIISTIVCVLVVGFIALVGIMLCIAGGRFDEVSDRDWQEFCRQNGYIEEDENEE